MALQRTVVPFVVSHLQRVTSQVNLRQQIVNQQYWIGVRTLCVVSVLGKIRARPKPQRNIVPQGTIFGNVVYASWNIVILR